MTPSVWRGCLGRAIPDPPATTERSPSACEQCLRRSWLLALLSARLEYQNRHPGRLLELVALGDEELMQAIGGRRRQELRDRYARFEPRDVRWAEGVQAVCRHHDCYPRALANDGLRTSAGAGTPANIGAQPALLYLLGEPRRLEALTRAPTVAIVGSRSATDYGMEMAHSLARGLAASGVTVASGLEDGIAIAAQLGALEVQGGALAVMPGGLDVACAARRRGVYERVRERGCAVSELPCGCIARRWCHVARERILAALAAVTVVVEADDSPRDLAGATIARSLGRAVAALPGRVTSPTSRGTHALLMAGAQLVRGPRDVLELLYEHSPPEHDPGGDLPPSSKRSGAQPERPELEPRLQQTLELVGAGHDTPAKLMAAGTGSEEVLPALSELELLGLLARGDGGRYVPREALASRPGPAGRPPAGGASVQPFGAGIDGEEPTR
jgi:DNA processing protein